MSAELHEGHVKVEEGALASAGQDPQQVHMELQQVNVQSMQQQLQWQQEVPQGEGASVDMGVNGDREGAWDGDGNGDAWEQDGQSSGDTTESSQGEDEESSKETGLQQQHVSASERAQGAKQKLQAAVLAAGCVFHDSDWRVKAWPAFDNAGKNKTSYEYTFQGGTKPLRLTSVKAATVALLQHQKQQQVQLPLKQKQSKTVEDSQAQTGGNGQQSKTVKRRPVETEQQKDERAQLEQQAVARKQLEIQHAIIKAGGSYLEDQWTVTARHGYRNGKPEFRYSYSLKTGVASMQCGDMRLAVKSLLQLQQSKLPLQAAAAAGGRSHPQLQQAQPQQEQKQQVKAAGSKRGKPRARHQHIDEEAKIKAVVKGRVAEAEMGETQRLQKAITKAGGVYNADDWTVTAKSGSCHQREVSYTYSYVLRTGSGPLMYRRLSLAVQGLLQQQQPQASGQPDQQPVVLAGPGQEAAGAMDGKPGAIMAAAPAPVEAADHGNMCYPDAEAEPSGGPHQDDAVTGHHGDLAQQLAGVQDQMEAGFDASAEVVLMDVAQQGTGSQEQGLKLPCLKRTAAVVEADETEATEPAMTVHAEKKAKRDDTAPQHPKLKQQALPGIHDSQQQSGPSSPGAEATDEGLPEHMTMEGVVNAPRGTDTANTPAHVEAPQPQRGPPTAGPAVSVASMPAQVPAPAPSLQLTQLPEVQLDSDKKLPVDAQAALMSALSKLFRELGCSAATLRLARLVKALAGAEPKVLLEFVSMYVLVREAAAAQDASMARGLIEEWLLV